MVFKAEKLVALLPANLTDTVLHSHQGLTYGGLILDEKLKLNETIEIFKNILIELERRNIELLNVKLIPNIYNQSPSEELNYILFLLKAEIIRKDVLSVIDNANELQIISKIRRRGIKKALESKAI